MKHLQKLIEPEALQQFWKGREQSPGQPTERRTCIHHKLRDLLPSGQPMPWNSGFPLPTPRGAALGRQAALPLDIFPGEPRNTRAFLFVRFLPTPGFYTVNIGLGFAGWVAIGDRLALLLVLRPFQHYQTVSEDSGRCFVW